MTSVTVLSTGGTIASTAGGDGGGATPTKGGDELVGAVPDLESHADLEVREVLQTPSFDMTTDGAAAVARAAREAVADGAGGVVVTHGTDTMEESAYYLDLVLDLGAPVAFTGAQRRPDEVSPDGPSNLLTAVRAVTDERFRGAGGVYVAFDEEVHAARDVTKGHASALSAFVSPDRSPVARVTRRGLRVLRAPGSRSASLDATETGADVPVVPSGMGAGRRAVDDAVAAGVDGIVVEGTGLGNATAPIGAAVGDAVDAGVPVVVVTRCRGGAVAPVYGASGGGERLRARGVIDGDDLPAAKARVKLMLAVAAADGDLTAVREAFGEG